MGALQLRDAAVRIFADQSAKRIDRKRMIIGTINRQDDVKITFYQCDSPLSGRVYHKK